jgi:hypothetical protein
MRPKEAIERFDIHLTNGKKTWWEGGFRVTQLTILHSNLDRYGLNFGPSRGKTLTQRGYAEALIRRVNHDERVRKGNKARVLKVLEIGKKPVEVPKPKKKREPPALKAAKKKLPPKKTTLKKTVKRLTTK